MVRRLARLLGAALLVLPLAACIFVLSPFPPTLSQVVAKTDLSAVIPAGQGNQYEVFVVTPAGGDFVILVSRSTSLDPVVVVMDSNLGLIQTYGWSSQLSGWGFGGSIAMTDSSGEAVIGNLLFTASGLSTVGASPVGMAGTSLSGPSLASVSSNANEVNFTMSGSLLSYGRYQPGWTYQSGSISLQVDAAGNSYWIEGAFNVDDTAGAGAVVLVLAEEGDSSNVTFVRLPLQNVVNNSLASPLLSNYPSKSYTNLHSSSIGFAGDSIAAYDERDGSLKRYSTSTLEEISSLPIGRSESYRVQRAYKSTGGWSVTYDPDTLTLQKVVNWW